MERWLGIPADGLLTMSIALAVPLDLPGARVLAHRMLEEGTVLIEVERTVRTTQCHRCGRKIDRVHGVDRPIRLRHLPVFGRRVVIETRPKRYRCPYCEDGPTTPQCRAWCDPNRPHATAFEQDVLKRLIHGTVATVTASRCNPAIKDFYQRLRAAGKPAKVALTACMRKLLTILNAILKTKTPWQPPAECRS